MALDNDKDNSATNGEVSTVSNMKYEDLFNGLILCISYAFKAF